MNRNDTYALAQQYHEKGQHAIARALWLQYAHVHTDDLMSHQNLTLSFLETNEYVQAEIHAGIWALLAPCNPQAHWIYGQLLRFNGKPEYDYLREFFRVEQLDPNWQDVHLAIAKTYFGRRETERAAGYFERALITAAGDEKLIQHTKWEYAMMLLTLGDYERGWLYYEERFNYFGPVGLNMATLPAPLWQGENLQNKTIVIHGEQGIGDEIMYASILNDLLKQGANIVFACFSKLKELMQQSFPNITVIAHARDTQSVLDWQNGIVKQWWKDLKHVDYQIPIGSLAHHLRCNNTSFPSTAYITTTPVLQDKHKTLLKQQAHTQGIDLAGKKLIGLVWCGNLDNPHGRAKSIELNELAELSDVIHQQNIVFVSLQNNQYGPQALEQDALPIIDMSMYTDEFSDTLALASLCEHIITIDTSYFHLCAAAGLSVTLLLRRNCDWRFGWTSKDCIWYPNVHILRQTTDLDWSNVIYQLKNKIQQGLTKIY